MLFYNIFIHYIYDILCKIMINRLSFESDKRSAVESRFKSGGSGVILIAYSNFENK